MMHRSSSEKWHDFWKYYRKLIILLGIPTLIFIVIITILELLNGTPIFEIFNFALYVILIYFLITILGAVLYYRVEKISEQRERYKKKR